MNYHVGVGPWDTQTIKGQAKTLIGHRVEGPLDVERQDVEVLVTKSGVFAGGL